MTAPMKLPKLIVVIDTNIQAVFSTDTVLKGVMLNKPVASLFPHIRSNFSDRISSLSQVDYTGEMKVSGNCAIVND